MKKMRVVGILLAMLLVVSVIGIAAANNGNAPGHSNAAQKGTATDDPYSQEVDYLFNNAGYHFWFTAGAGWASASPYYESGDQYHNVYKYEVEDSSNWCGPVSIPDREPYNIGGTAGDTAYFKVWNVTTQTWICGSEGD